MNQKCRKNKIDHYSEKEAFFKDADYHRKTLVKYRFRGMGYADMALYADRIGSKSFRGFTLTDRLVHELWAHYNGGVK